MSPGRDSDAGAVQTDVLRHTVEDGKEEITIHGMPLTC